MKLPAFLRRDETKVAAAAVASRALVLAWSVVATSFARPYDTGKWHLYDGGAPPLNAIAARMYHFTNWDGHYFMSIASHGYRYEQHFAFFPVWPALVRGACRLASVTSGLAASAWGGPSNGGQGAAAAITGARASDPIDPSCAVMSSLALNLRLFTLTSLMLYRLTLTVSGGDRRMALLTSLLFAFNPAGVFFTAAYTETLFAFLSFTALWLLECAAGAGTAAAPATATARSAEGEAGAATTAGNETEDGQRPSKSGHRRKSVAGGPGRGSAAPAPSTSTFTPAPPPLRLTSALTAYGLLLAGAAVAAVAAGTRSNGLLLAAWVVYAGARVWRRLHASAAASVGPGLLTLAWAVHWAAVAMAVSLAVLPWALFQAYGWGLFCSAAGYASTIASGGSSATGLPTLRASAWLWFVSLSRRAMGLLLPLSPALGLGNDGLTAAGTVGAGAGSTATVSGMSTSTSSAGLSSSSPMDRPWCSQSTLGPLLPFPPLYSFVQKEYWGVAPFAYWELKQLPQFLLAAPVLALCVWAVRAGLLTKPAGVDGAGSGTGRPGSSSAAGGRGGGWRALQPQHLRYVRDLACTLVPPLLQPVGWAEQAQLAAGEGKEEPEGTDSDSVTPTGAAAALLTRPTLLPYLLHWAFLCCVGVVSMYVQVTVRVTAAACPALYWAAASAWLQEEEKEEQGQQRGQALAAAGQGAQAPAEDAAASAGSAGGGAGTANPAITSQARRRRGSTAGAAGKARAAPEPAAAPAAAATPASAPPLSLPPPCSFRTAWLALCLCYILLGTTLFSLHYNWT